MTLYCIIERIGAELVCTWSVVANDARSARKKAEAIGIVVVKVERERKRK